MSNNKLIIGLTGGIGSGKSEVSKRFEALSIDVIDADQIARDVVALGTEGLANIAKHFGSHILLGDGTLDRAKLREIIFTEPDEKIWLEQELHPRINQLIRSKLAASSSPYCILSSPLLLETNQHLLVNRILVVDTSELLQLERASQRDQTKHEQIHAIMATQLSRAERCGRATDIIQNHADLSALDEQVEKLHLLYLELAEANSSEAH